MTLITIYNYRICSALSHLCVTIFYTSTFQSSSSHIYLNVTTLEDLDLTIELSSEGFRIVSSNGHNETGSKDLSTELPVFETPYSLLDSVSPAYIREFGKALTEKLNLLQDQ